MQLVILQLGYRGSTRTLRLLTNIVELAEEVLQFSILLGDVMDDQVISHITFIDLVSAVATER